MFFRRRPRVRRISSDESVCDVPIADHSSWVDVLKQGNYCPIIDFTTGSKVTGPRSEERRVGKECRSRLSASP